MNGRNDDGEYEKTITRMSTKRVLTPTKVDISISTGVKAAVLAPQIHACSAGGIKHARNANRCRGSRNETRAPK